MVTIPTPRAHSVALSDLRGRAKAFARSSAPLAEVQTAISLASRTGATRDEIVSAVAEGGADAVKATKLTALGRYHVS